MQPIVDHCSKKMLIVIPEIINCNIIIHKPVSLSKKKNSLRKKYIALIDCKNIDSSCKKNNYESEKGKNIGVPN